MNQLFLQILNMSITAIYVILFVMVVRLCLKKLPKIFSYALWGVVLFRLVVPFSFESIFSLIPVTTQTVSHNIMYSQTVQIQSGINVVDHVLKNSSPLPVVSTVANSMQLWIDLGETIWLLGLVALLIYSIFTAIRLSRKLKFAKPVFDNVHEMKGIKTPFVFGVIKPKIYLPTGLIETEKTFIIKHEQTHIKRFDHIIKLFAFLVLCIHWFNPLVWVAFFLMGEDMELSCDESVIKQMGSGIKKDYSASLLFLSTGRRIIGGCPLAFGENNTKGRIVNILNYKKTAFWVVIVAVIAVTVVCVGLMSNPQKELLTVEDYAEQFMEQAIKDYENVEWTDVKIIDSKITKLEKIALFDELCSSPLEIWNLEYRFKPDDMSKAPLPGGMNAVDGWITEEASMGKPMLIFSYEDSKPQYLGCIRSGEGDYSTIAGQETALRIFLEGKGLLPPETYSGKHIIVKFPLSTGETCQLLLSQPIIQGDVGIWCVERWMDGNGNVYYATPKTNTMIVDYYKTQQKQCDDGHKPALLDPLQVALDYINNDIGQYVSFNELIPQYSTKAEDFLITPESHYMGYISNFKADNSSFHLDQVEWVTDDDAERLRELNINPDELNNGFYIYNPANYPMYCQVTEQTQYSIITWDDDMSFKSITREEFIKYLEQYSDYVPPFRIITKDGYVQSITEQYVP
ncbi:MAG: M56 family metallopeptidase [Clostridia bacterium]|nr:M56 family metallopeptidase [Clostridia bacterium]MDD4047518.1 M56 family metallopeptidase [Clostridia bacterium]